MTSPPTLAMNDAAGAAGARVPLPWASTHIWAAILAALWTALCLAAAGGTLGTVIGALAVVTVLVPHITAAESCIRTNLLTAAAVLVGVSAVMAFAAYQHGWSWSGWTWITLTVAIYAIALLGICALLIRIRVNSALSTAAVVLLGLLWLAWPFWMAPWLRSGDDEQLVTNLARIHPIMATNGALRDTFPVPWAQQRLAYRLTNLGDDVMYEVPATLAWCLAIHALIGIITLTLSLLPLPRRRLTEGSPPHPPAD